MTPSNSLTKPSPYPVSKLMKTPELVERLAVEMRARSGGELPHAFCVEQVKRQLAGKSAESGAANAAHMMIPAERASVFHSWAISE
ncbi:MULTISPECIES: hypothetical protein [Rhizobium/Agrobacterium group]|jgi:hypothetical protein|uniref:hypothetical protein n=1 Tax=Rhizobium/Agrobacterium group TaxID=227290 RepID=UPI0008A7C6ED|nr:MULTISPECIES: hypothetical protein [Rhizobium/Agrobacterium group]RYE67623.1 MAG: hypothetical protein EOP17_08270 [Rhizobiaceae bacterium]MBD8650929.1 hypothetical protein [Rhizobium sp. CFBP 13726]MBP2461704.1 hypothetical protein [Rhizobium sp. PvP014]MBP2529099.1 hypothetical protein [Rhizobium sp. PvP099]NSY17629.1 hypothetical protein [Neorhizobium sp. AL 9.2.2]